MDEDELYFFDLCGYICVRDVLSAAEVAAANAAVDAHSMEAVQSGHRKGAPRIPDLARRWMIPPAGTTVVCLAGNQRSRGRRS